MGDFLKKYLIWEFAMLVLTGVGGHDIVINGIYSFVATLCKKQDIHGHPFDKDNYPTMTRLRTQLPFISGLAFVQTSRESTITQQWPDSGPNRPVLLNGHFFKQAEK